MRSRVGGFLFGMAVALILRSTALSSLAARGIVLDVLACAVVIWSLRNGDAWGCSFGFFLGLAADLDSAHWLGRHALGLTLLGYGVGRLARTLVRDSSRTQFVLFAVATALHQMWASVFELTGPGEIPYLAIRTLVSVVASASLGTALLWIMRRLAGRPLFGHAHRSLA